MNLMKVLEGLRSRPDASGPIFAASKHWNYIFESRDYNSHSDNFKNGYLRVGNWKFKGGASDRDGKIMKATMVALLEKLLAEGALHAYSIDEETVHSRNPDCSRSPSLPTALKASTNSMRQSTKMKAAAGLLGSCLNGCGQRARCHYWAAPFLTALWTGAPE